jgi:hypothetical protein
MHRSDCLDSRSGHHIHLLYLTREASISEMSDSLFGLEHDCGPAATGTEKQTSLLKIKMSVYSTQIRG